MGIAIRPDLLVAGRAEREGVMDKRMASNWTFICLADEDYFIPNWNDIPKEIKNELEENGPIPCEGSGNTGPWCAGCRFGDSMPHD